MPRRRTCPSRLCCTLHSLRSSPASLQLARGTCTDSFAAVRRSDSESFRESPGARRDLPISRRSLSEFQHFDLPPSYLALPELEKQHYELACGRLCQLYNETQVHSRPGSLHVFARQIRGPCSTSCFWKPARFMCQFSYGVYITDAILHCCFGDATPHISDRVCNSASARSKLN